MKIKPQGPKIKKITSNTSKKIKSAAQKKYKTKTPNPLTLSKQFKTQEQVGSATTELMFKEQNLESDLEKNTNFFVKIAKESGNEKMTQEVAQSIRKNENLIKGWSKILDKSPEETSKLIKQAQKEIQKTIQETAPELPLATTKKLAETTVDAIQNYQSLKNTIEKKIQLRVDIATQSIFNALKKQTSPQPIIIEGSPPFEVATIPEISFEKTVERINNPAERAKQADVPFEVDQTIQDIVTQESTENNVFESDITLEAIFETLAGGSPESSAIINNKGLVETNLSAKSTKKLEEVFGQKAKDLFTKDSEFIDINQETNNLNSIIKTDKEGNAIIIADGLKPIEELPAEFNKLKQEIVEIETKKALEELPSLETMLEKALKPEPIDQVLEDFKKEINDDIAAQQKSTLKEELPGEEKFPEAPPKKRLRQPRRSNKKPAEEIAPQEESSKKIGETGEAKDLSQAKEKTPTIKKTAGEEKEHQTLIEVPAKQDAPVPEGKPKSLAETVREKAAQIREKKPEEKFPHVKKEPIKEAISKKAEQATLQEREPSREITEPSEKTTLPKPERPEAKSLEPPIKQSQKNITIAPKQPLVSPETSPTKRISDLSEKKAIVPQEQFREQLPSQQLKEAQKEIAIKPKQPEATLLSEHIKSEIQETEAKKLSPSDQEFKSFQVKTNEVKKNLDGTIDIYKNKGLNDIGNLDEQAQKKIGDILEKTIQSTEIQLQESQNDLENLLQQAKNQESTVKTKEQIVNTRAETLKKVVEINQKTKTELNAIKSPQIRQLAKDMVDLITRATKKSLSSMTTLATISAELVNLNNGNFSNAKEIVTRLEVLKKQLEQEVKENKEEAEKLAKMRNQEENQRQQQEQRQAKSKTKETEQHAETKKSMLSSAILKTITGLITAIAIDEFDAKEIAELSQQITNAQQLLDTTEEKITTEQEKPVNQDEKKKKEKENTKKRLLPLINQSTNNRNRATAKAFEKPFSHKDWQDFFTGSNQNKQDNKEKIKLKKETNEITPQIKEIQEIDIPLDAARENLDFRYEQDSELLGEQLHQIEQKVERKLERTRNRVKTEKEEIGKEKIISDYKAAYDAADAQQMAGQPQQPMPVTQEGPIPATMTPAQPSSYMPSTTQYQPSFDHSFDMFDFSGLPTDFENFDLGYFGDLDFLSEFGLGDWESSENFLGSSKETAVERQNTAENRLGEGLLHQEITHPETLLDKKEREERWATYKTNTSDKKIGPATEESQEEEVEQKQVIRTPYKQYLIPALAIITIGCAALFYWFM